MKIFVREYYNRKYIDRLNSIYKDKVEYFESDFNYYIKINTNSFTIDIDEFRKAYTYEFSSELEFEFWFKPTKDKYQFVKEQIDRYVEKCKHVPHTENKYDAISIYTVDDEIICLNIKFGLFEEKIPTINIEE